MHDNMKVFFRSGALRIFLTLACLAGVLAFAGAAVAEELPAGLEQKEVTITSKMNRFAGEDMKSSSNLNPEEEEVDKMVGLVSVKRPDRKKGQRLLDPTSYRFNGRTVVRNAKGEKVTMNELLVPCQARIYFYPNDRKAPVLYGIDMTGFYPNSSKRWSDEHKKE